MIRGDFVAWLKQIPEAQRDQELYAIHPNGQQVYFTGLFIEAKGKDWKFSGQFTHPNGNTLTGNILLNLARSWGDHDFADPIVRFPDGSEMTISLTPPAKAPAGMVGVTLK